MQAEKELTAVILKPTPQFYLWAEQIHSKAAEETDINQPAGGNTIILIPYASSSENFSLFLNNHLEEILNSEFSRWTSNEMLWPPRIDLDLLTQYFNLEIHSTIIDWTKDGWS